MDRFFDNYIMTPMSKIVGDRIRPDEAHDPHGSARRGRCLTPPTAGWTA
jgi:glutathione S-transferase